MTAQNEKARVKRVIEKARGVIVMADLDPKVKHQAIPLPVPPFDAPDFKREWLKIQADWAQVNDAGMPRERATAHMFQDIWDEREVDADGMSTPQTYFDMVLWGNCLLDEIPSRHVVLIKIPNGLHMVVPEIADRMEFWTWQHRELPGMLDLMRQEGGQ